MAVLGVGAGLEELQAAVRTARDRARERVHRASRRAELMPSAGQSRSSALRSRQLDETAQIWGRYKPEYEQLFAAAATDDEEEDGQLAVRRLQRKRAEVSRR